MTCVKKDCVQVKCQKKLMMWKAEELSMKVWHKTGSDISRKVTSMSRTNQSQGSFIVLSIFLKTFLLLTCSIQYIFRISIVEPHLCCFKFFLYHWKHCPAFSAILEILYSNSAFLFFNKIFLYLNILLSYRKASFAIFQYTFWLYFPTSEFKGWAVSFA